MKTPHDWDKTISEGDVAKNGLRNLPAYLRDNFKLTSFEPTRIGQQPGYVVEQHPTRLSFMTKASLFLCFHESEVQGLEITTGKSARSDGEIHIYIRLTSGIIRISRARRSGAGLIGSLLNFLCKSERIEVSL